MAGLLGFFNHSDLPPHGFCLLWDPTLIWLHVVSDALIGVAYYSIPLALAYFVLHRRDLALRWVLGLFAGFILACGTTHFLEIWVLWHPDYAIQGLVKLLTAAISIATAVLLWPLVIRLISFPTPAQFRAVTDQLASEVVGRQRAVTSLTRSEQSLRLLLEGVTDLAIFMLDPGGRISSWNSGAARITGYTEREAIGQHFAALYTPQERGDGLPLRALETAARVGKMHSEGWRVRKDGSQFWASMMIEALHDDSGTLIGFAKVTRDITEQRQAALALDQTRAALAQAQKMETVGQLTGGVAHDFNNLLTAILGGADLLSRRVATLDDTSRRVLTGITDAAQRGAVLVQRLLAFSRKQTLRPQATDINQLLAAMSELLRRALSERVQVETMLAGGVWPCFVDRNQLENAVLNLAINARDAMPAGGRLTLATGNATLAAGDIPAGDYATLSVGDSGTGMDAATLARAFEPFFTTKAEGAGTGLGLSQVYGFVRQTGGDVRIDSAPGQGTTVCIYLPRHRGGGVEARRAIAEDIKPPRGSETVLVVEDHADVRVYAVEALSHLGYRVLEAANAEFGLELLARHGEIAVLFTDVGLPGSSGRALADEARRRRPGLRVLFTTGYACDAIAQHGVLDTGLDVLPKPYTVERLARTLRAVLSAAAVVPG